MKHAPTVAQAALLTGLCGCLSHRVETAPIEVRPIHVIVDVNVRVQRELDEFFDFEQQVDPAKGKAQPDTKQDPETRKD